MTRAIENLFFERFALALHLRLGRRNRRIHPIVSPSVEPENRRADALDRIGPPTPPRSVTLRPSRILFFTVQYFLKPSHDMEQFQIQFNW